MVLLLTTKLILWVTDLLAGVGVERIFVFKLTAQHLKSGGLCEKSWKYVKVLKKLEVRFF